MYYFKASFLYFRVHQGRWFYRDNIGNNWKWNLGWLWQSPCRELLEGREPPQAAPKALSLCSLDGVGKAIEHQVGHYRIFRRHKIRGIQYIIKEGTVTE